MSNKTRKHIWPASLVMALAIVGVLAALVVLSATPSSTSAHSDADHDQACMDMTAEQVAQHDEDELLINAADPMLCGDEDDAMEPAAGTPEAPTGLMITDRKPRSISNVVGRARPGPQFLPSTAEDGRRG